MQFFSFFDKDDLDDQIESLASLDYQQSTEFRARILALGLPIIAGYLLYDLVFPLFWFFVYGVTIRLQGSLFSRLHSRSTKGQVSAAIVGQMINSILFMVLPVYLFSHGGLIFALAAFAAVFSSILHNVATRVRIPIIASSDAVLNILFLVYAAVGLTGKVGTIQEKLVIILIMAALCVYYAVSLISVLKVRSALSLASKNFAETQKMQALGLMTGGIAHDFNNILTVVMGNLDLHGEVRSIKEKNQLASEAFASAQRASVLVAQLLAFSRQANLVPVAVDLHSFVDNFWTMTGRILPASIQFHSNIPEDLPPVLADQNQFEAALLNLVLNARDAMMPGGGELRITCVQVDLGPAHQLVATHSMAPGQYVQLLISDSGVGIPWHIRKKIFDPFFTTKKIGEGSGLGLSMAKGFVEQSKGALTIDSQPGSGTVVTMTLPVAVGK